MDLEDLRNLPYKARRREERRIAKLFEDVDMVEIWRNHTIAMKEHLERNRRSRGRNMKPPRLINSYAA